jgi:outer membrane immunogenic protein
MTCSAKFNEKGLSIQLVEVVANCPPPERLLLVWRPNMNWAWQLRLGLLALIGGASVCGDVKADGLPEPVPALPYNVPSSWAGFYVGVELGGKNTDTKWTTTSLRDNTPAGISTIDGSSPAWFAASGFRGGSYAGYNIQFTRWVIGLEGDIAWADTEQRRQGLPGCASPQGCTVGVLPPSTHDSASVENTWDASVRGRLGYLVAPNILLYGTGGVAWQHIESTGTCSQFLTSPFCNTAAGVPFGPQSLTNSTTRSGFTYGGGLEGKLAGNWLLRLEYRHSDFGDWREVLPFTQITTIPGGNNTYRYTLSDHSDIVTIGLAYKFGCCDGPAPLK